MVTLPAESVGEIRRQVGGGKTDSVSGLVRHAVQVCWDEVAGWGALFGHASANAGRPIGLDRTNAG
jgi:hypothetical protein